MRKFLFTLFLLFSVSAWAEDFKILFLNTENIKIGAKFKKAGDVFSDGEKIHWKDERQAMKVVSLVSKKQYIFVSEAFKQQKTKSVKDYLVKNNRLSTMSTSMTEYIPSSYSSHPHLELSSVAASVGERLYWVDPIMVYIDIEPEEGDFFVLKYDEKYIILPFENRQLFFDQSIWGENEPYPLKVDLFYHFSNGEEELVKSEIMLIPIPVSLKKK